MTTDSIVNLDPTVHSPVRLAVLSILMAVAEADFAYLKEATQTTDGNLSTHLAKLEEKGLIRVRKSFKGKKPRTSCVVTEKGRRAFAEYVKAMEGVLHPKE